MPDLFRFDGRVAVVTGAGRGLGRAYAKLLGSLGAAVVVNNVRTTADSPHHRCVLTTDPRLQRTEALAVQVADEIVAAGGVAIPDGHDVSQEGEETIQRAIAEFGRIDVLINNAGQLRDRSFAKMSWEEWKDVSQLQMQIWRCTCRSITDGCGHLVYLTHI